jgi:hypothetical protein
MVFLWFSYSYVSHNQMVHGIQRMAIAIGSPSTQEDSHCAECNDGYYLFSRDCQERWDQVTSSSASEMAMIELNQKYPEIFGNIQKYSEISRNIQCGSRWEIQKQIQKHPLTI